MERGLQSTRESDDTRDPTTFELRVVFVRMFRSFAAASCANTLPNSKPVVPISLSAPILSVSALSSWTQVTAMQIQLPRGPKMGHVPQDQQTSLLDQL